LQRGVSEASSYSATRNHYWEIQMLWTILLVLLLLWALGFGFGVVGNFIHILLIVALVVFVLQLVQGRSVG
jgi:uncharacterized membrane protein YhaH (DUF805 family)